jgi:fatty acid desaturase
MSQVCDNNDPGILGHPVSAGMSTDDPIYEIPKSSLRDGSGQSYYEFKRNLTPRYSVVWRDIALGYVALALIAGSLVLAQALSIWLAIPTVIAGAVLIGFFLAYLNLFFHEAAHWNLARSRKTNDVLADVFIGTWFGQSIEAYRAVHFGHHQHHGTPMDSEHSYFDPLNIRFLAGAMLGIRAFQVMRNRESFTDKTTQIRSSASRNALLRGLLCNGLIVGLSLWFGKWMFAAAWIVGMASFFPFFNAVRQLLEHRNELALDSVNYAEVAHGRITRLFGDSLLAQTLGGAGFNRHLLHHWEPQVSYTRLADLETFVLNTSYATLFEQRRTTYTRAFTCLVRLGSR